MKILFICSRNQWRSPTAEQIYRNHPEHEVRSAGTAPGARIKINAKSLLWADIIFAMEKKHKQRLIAGFPNEAEPAKIVVLDIEDNYLFMDPELIEMIRGFGRSLSSIKNHFVCADLR